MRNSTLLDALFSETRQQVLAATLMQPEKWWYLSDLAEHTGLAISGVHREIGSLAEAGILETKKEGNLRYCRPHPACPLLPELTRLIIKTVGLADLIKDALTPFTKSLDWAFIYGSLAAFDARCESDVDLMLIGAVALSKVAPKLHEAAERLGREVNPTLYKPEEFATKLADGNHFLRTVMDSPKIFVLGNADELTAAFTAKSVKDTHHQSK